MVVAGFWKLDCSAMVDDGGRSKEADVVVQHESEVHHLRFRKLYCHSIRLRVSTVAEACNREWKTIWRKMHSLFPPRLRTYK